MNNSEKTIYLHIGMPKAGSTSLQSLLYNNREQFEENGLFYPVVDFDNSVSFYKKSANYRFIRRKFSEDLKKERFNNYEKYWVKNFLPLIQKNDCSKILLSDEEIWLGNISPKICNIMLKQGFKVKAFICLRSPAEYLASLWQEYTKTYICNFSSSPEEFFNYNFINYALVLKYIEFLGGENVIIRPFDKKYWKNGNFMEDFFATLGISTPTLTQSNKKENDSYNRYLCEFTSIINALNLTAQQKRELLYNYAETLSNDNEINKIDRKSPAEVTAFIQAHSSSEPKIIDTLSKDLIIKTNEKYREILKQISSLCDNCLEEEYFLFGKYKNHINKIDYDKGIFTLKHADILKKAIKYNTNNNKNQVFSIRKSGINRVIYLLGIKLTFKRRRKHWHNIEI